MANLLFLNLFGRDKIQYKGVFRSLITNLESEFPNTNGRSNMADFHAEKKLCTQLSVILTLGYSKTRPSVILRSGLGWHPLYFWTRGSGIQWSEFNERGNQ